jgi:hypothetical protein
MGQDSTTEMKFGPDCRWVLARSRDASWSSVMSPIGPGEVKW